MNIPEIPFNRFLSITVSDREGSLLEIPASDRYANHLGTVHASALMALAEASSGELLLRCFRGVEIPVIPVVRRFESKFKKPATGGIYSKGHISPEAATQFLSTLQTKGRALLEVNVEVYDEQDQQAMTATVEWFVAKQG